MDMNVKVERWMGTDTIVSLKKKRFFGTFEMSHKLILLSYN